MSRHPYDSAAAHSPSGSTRACNVVQDFAFADTVVFSDLEEAVPPSGIVVSEEHQVTPLLYPLPDATYHHQQQQLQQQHLPQHQLVPEEQYVMVDGIAMLQVPMPRVTPPPPPMTLWDRLGVWLARSREEMALLWSATGRLEQAHDRTGSVVYEEDPLARAATVGRRVRTLWSFFEWDRTDLVRAAWIGVLVFILTATVGAFVLTSSSNSPPSFDNVSSSRDLR